MSANGSPYLCKFEIPSASLPDGAGRAMASPHTCPQPKKPFCSLRNGQHLQLKIEQVFGAAFGLYDQVPISVSYEDQPESPKNDIISVQQRTEALCAQGWSTEIGPSTARRIRIPEHFNRLS
jgi:hypothetical protein